MMKWLRLSENQYFGFFSLGLIFFPLQKLPYGEGSDPVIDKSEFVFFLFEQLDKHGLLPEKKFIIDRCVRNVYENYQTGGKLPTLAVMREDLLEQPETEAKRLALKMELFTSGSLSAFAHKTNVDVCNRLIDYNIMDLGSQLKTMGLRLWNAYVLR